MAATRPETTGRKPPGQRQHKQPEPAPPAGVYTVPEKPQVGSGAKLVRASAYPQGGGQLSAPELIVAGQGADAGRRSAVLEARARHSLSRERSGPVDEITCATVDERAVAKGDAGEAAKS